MTIKPKREIVLGGVPIPIAPSARVQKFNITQFPQKTLVGPTVTQNDHSIRSVLALSNFAGLGRQIYRQADEGVERFWYSSLETRYHNYLTLPPLLTETSDANALTNSRWFSYDFNGNALSFSSGATTIVGVTPVSPSGGVTVSASGSYTNSILSLAQFQGKLFACRSGATYIYGTGFGALTAPFPVPTGTPAGQFDYLLPIDNALYGIYSGSTPPSLWNSTAPAQNSAPWTKIMDIPVYDGIVWATVGYSGDGYQVIYLLSQHALWQLDPATQRCALVYRLTSQNYGNPFPIIAQWDRTRSIYIAGGRTIVEVGPGTIRHISPFADDGLPDSSSAAVPGLNGLIVGLFTMENWLGCVVRDDTAGQSSILVYDEIGWHVLGVSPNNGETWTGGFAYGDYVFASMNATKVVSLYAPDEKRPPWLRGSSNRAYAVNGFLVTPFFHYDFPDVVKEADEFTIQGFNFSANEIAQVYYQIDKDSGSWTLLGQTAGDGSFTEGTTKMSFGNNGVAFYQIRFKIVLARGASTAAPVIRSMGFRFVLRPKALYGWTVPVDCRKAYGLKTAEQLKDYLFTAYETSTKLSLTYGRQATTYVLVSGVNGGDTLNKDYPEGVFQLTLLQVKSDVA